jgi:hypothetical protein
MDWREKKFREKFAAAAAHLNSTSGQIVSLKLRENIGSHNEYQELLHALEREGGIRSTRLDGNFQGGAYLLGNSKTKVIIVEHETGLEILYISGSVASLIGIIPMVLKCWSWLRGRHGPPHHAPDFHRIETRRFDQNDKLIEEHANALDVPWAAPLSVMNTAFLSAAENIDAEIQQLRGTVQDLGKRIEALEVAVAAKPKSRSRTRQSATRPGAK